MNFSVTIKKSEVLIPNKNKNVKKHFVKVGRSFVKVGEAAQTQTTTTKDETTETVKKSNSNIVGKVLTTAVTAAVVLSPPVAGYYAWGTAGLVTGVVLAVPLALVGSLVLYVTWNESSLW